MAAGLLARLELERAAEGEGSALELPEAFEAWDSGDRERALEDLQSALEASDDPDQRDLLRQVMVAIFTELGSDAPASPLASPPPRRSPDVEMAAADAAAGVGFFAAAAAGIVSFLSPCVLPLVPGYLSAVTGVSPTELERVGWRRVLAPSLVFIGSFSVIFIVLGLTATGLGEALSDNRSTLEERERRAHHRDGRPLRRRHVPARLAREWHVEALLERAGKGGPAVAGAAFAIAWTPCIGPTLGAILTAAAASWSAAHGALLLLAYSAGLGIPFLAPRLPSRA